MFMSVQSLPATIASLINLPLASSVALRHPAEVAGALGGLADRFITLFGVAVSHGLLLVDKLQPPSCARRKSSSRGDPRGQS